MGRLTISVPDELITELRKHDFNFSKVCCDALAAHINVVIRRASLRRSVATVEAASVVETKGGAVLNRMLLRG